MSQRKKIDHIDYNRDNVNEDDSNTKSKQIIQKFLKRIIYLILVKK